MSWCRCFQNFIVAFGSQICCSVSNPYLIHIKLFAFVLTFAQVAASMFQSQQVFVPSLLRFMSKPTNLKLLYQFETYFIAPGSLAIPYLFSTDSFLKIKQKLRFVKLYFTKTRCHFPLQVYVVLSQEFLEELPLPFLFHLPLLFLIPN